MTKPLEKQRADMGTLTFSHRDPGMEPCSLLLRGLLEISPRPVWLAREMENLKPARERILVDREENWYSS